jgi:hypothetical protein
MDIGVNICTSIFVYAGAKNIFSINLICLLSLDMSRCREKEKYWKFYELRTYNFQNENKQLEI